MGVARHANCSLCDGEPTGFRMLISAMIFFLIALAAAVFGFGTTALGPAAVLHFVFYGAVAFLVLSLMGHLMRRV